MKKYLIGAAMALIAMLPNVASADLIIMDAGFGYTLETMDNGLTVGIDGFDESYLNGAHGTWNFSGANAAMWSIGDRFIYNGSATNGVDPNAAAELRILLTNNTTNPLSASFELEGGRLFSVDIDSPRELQGIASFFLFDENGSLETYDTYNQTINTDYFSNSAFFPSPYLQEVTIAPNSSAIVQMNYGSLINGDATNAVPEPNSAVLFGALTIGGLAYRHRFRKKPTG